MVKRPKARPAQHGAAMLTRALAHMPRLDPSLPVVRRVRQLERDLTRQLGGRQSLTVAERLLVHQAAVKVVICQAMESWILREPRAGDGGTRLATVLVHDGCQRTLNQLLSRL